MILRPTEGRSRGADLRPCPHVWPTHCTLLRRFSTGDLITCDAITLARNLRTLGAVTMTYTFTEVDVPVRQGGPGRKPDPNPFLDKVAELIENDGELRDVAVSFVVTDDEDSTAVRQIKGQLARAGIVHNVSVYKRIDSVPEGSQVTFWVQPRITPNRKPRASSDEAASNGHAVEASDQGSSSDGTPDYAARL